MTSLQRGRHSLRNPELRHGGDLLRRPLGEIGQGAVLDSPVLPVGFTEKNCGVEFRLGTTEMNIPTVYALITLYYVVFFNICMATVCRQNDEDGAVALVSWLFH